MGAPFKFKEFTVNQDRCAMKIGTDGVLLGAWASVTQQPNTVLDIGAGTGVLSLQLAQRCTAQLIDAVEIDSNAFEQCTDNFEQSPWADRLYCYHAAIQEYASQIEEKYDLIVSNPPFYNDQYKSGDPQRDTARFTDALPFNHLVICVAQLLEESGTFAVIIPKKSETEFIAVAAKANLFPKRICSVFGSPNSEAKRILIEFSFNKSAVKTSELIIETSRHKYTQDYIKLTKDFYLNM